MIQKSETAMAKASLIKAFRSNIRLGFMIQADERCNQLLPAVERLADEKIREAEEAGQSLVLDLADVLRELDQLSIKADSEAA